MKTEAFKSFGPVSYSQPNLPVAIKGMIFAQVIFTTMKWTISSII